MSHKYEWKKSSACSANHTCVEVWRSSGYCDEGCSCIEVSHTSDEWHVRDSKNQDGPVLTFNKKEWKAFILGVKAGEFDI